MNLSRLTLVVLLALLTSFGHGDEKQATEIVLFDGTSTKGWHQAGPGEFEFKDGTLISRGGMGLFWHEREFGDFVLSLEFKVEREQDNSGVFLRFPNPGDDPWVAVHRGHEVQIQGDGTGDIYDFQRRTEANTKPVGEWNKMEIKVVGNRYIVKLNGKQVNDFESKDRPLRGHVGIQNHDPDSVVTFRNIRAVELAPPKEARIAPLRRAPRQLVSGLIGEYFKNTRDLPPTGQPFLVRIDESLNFAATNREFHGTKLSRDFAARWTGYLRVARSGLHTFSLASDDGSKLYIADELLIESKAPTSGTEAQVHLDPGLYAIRVEFEQGPGTAALILSWKTPGADKLEPVPPSTLFHERGADARIAWDHRAWDRSVWSSREWARKYGERYEKMDYGPFLSSTMNISENNTVNKAIAIRLGKDDRASIAFDTELLRYAGAWTDGFLYYRGVVFDGSHGPNPTPEGRLLFTTPNEPGAVAGDTPGRLVDPRPSPYGTLPRSWGHYKGLFLSGDRTVLYYTVGDCHVLDSPWVEMINDKPVLTRTIQLSPSDQPLTILATQDTPERRTTIHTPRGVGIVAGDEGRGYLVFPPRNEVVTYTIAFTREGDSVSGRAMGRLINSAIDLRELCTGGPTRWNEVLTTKGELGTGDQPYVLDTIAVPEDNPYFSWLRFGGLDFFSDGRAALSTWSGDVWIVSGIDDKLENITWKRFATGLFQPLGLRIVNDQIYVLGRDQITRFHDLNNNGEADFYENFNNDCEVSPGFHEFSFDLQTDSQGNFYYAKGGPVRPGGRGWETLTAHNGTVLKVSADGSKLEVFATGVRAPNGMSVGPNDEVTVGDNEGTWVPACRLSFVRKGSFLGVVDLAKRPVTPEDHQLPIVWFPHGEVDNSSGGQVWVTSGRWGPLEGRLLHLSYGKCALFLVMTQEVDGQVQGGVVRFPKLDFLTGISRARFHPIDGQLYVTGLRGWQTSATRDGAFQRVRYTGQPVRMPTALRVAHNGVHIDFTTELDTSYAADADNYAVEVWNYNWSADYGSPEFSVLNPNQQGRDPLEVVSATVSADRRSVFLEIEDIQPVMQMKIEMKIRSADGKRLEYAVYNTINAMPSAGDSVATSPSPRAGAHQP